MLSFIVVVLILGALLSCVFGKGIGQLFVLGTGMIVMLCFAILLIMLSPLIWGYFFPPSRSASSFSYGTSGSTSGTSGSTSGNSSTAYASPVGSQPHHLRIGVDDTSAPNPVDEAYLNKNFNVPAGVGNYVSSVDANSPAENAGLHVGDIIVSAQVDDSRRVWLSPSYDLGDFENAHPSSVPTPISLHVFRFSARGNYIINVTPQ